MDSCDPQSALGEGDTKNEPSTEDDLYSDLFSSDIAGDKDEPNLQNFWNSSEVVKLKEENGKLKLAVEKLVNERKSLTQQRGILLTNISALYKTARLELNRKDKAFMELQKKYDDLVFRRNQNYPASSMIHNVLDNKTADVPSWNATAQGKPIPVICEPSPTKRKVPYNYYVENKKKQKIRAQQQPKAKIPSLLDNIHFNDVPVVELPVATSEQTGFVSGSTDLNPNDEPVIAELKDVSKLNGEVHCLPKSKERTTKTDAAKKMDDKSTIPKIDCKSPKKRATKDKRNHSGDRSKSHLSQKKKLHKSPHKRTDRKSSTIVEVSSQLRRDKSDGTSSDKRSSASDKENVRRKISAARKSVVRSPRKQSGSSRNTTTRRSESDRRSKTRESRNAGNGKPSKIPSLMQNRGRSRSIRVDRSKGGNDRKRKRSESAKRGKKSEIDSLEREREKLLRELMRMDKTS